jgi:hypothetical protein
MKAEQCKQSSRLLPVPLLLSNIASATAAVYIAGDG